MGNLFTLDDSGHLDSSILIRTLYSDEQSGLDSFNFEYAAGSGITLSSLPEQELAEIYTKCTAVAEKKEGGRGE